MSKPITKIELKLWTAQTPGASTDGRVYLGLAGREYAVKSSGSGHDFQPAPEPHVFVFGQGANVALAEHNNPAAPWQTDFEDVALCPKFLRLAPKGDDDNWNLQRADLTVWYRESLAAGAPTHTQNFSRLSNSPHLWLGVQRGLFLFF